MTNPQEKKSWEDEFEDLKSEEWNNEKFGEVCCELGFDTWPGEIIDFFKNAVIPRIEHEAEIRGMEKADRELPEPKILRDSFDSIEINSGHNHAIRDCQKALHVLIKEEKKKNAKD